MLLSSEIRMIPPYNEELMDFDNDNPNVVFIERIGYINPNKDESILFTHIFGGIRNELAILQSDKFACEACGIYLLTTITEKHTNKQKGVESHGS